MIEGPVVGLAVVNPLMTAEPATPEQALHRGAAPVWGPYGTGGGGDRRQPGDRSGHGPAAGGRRVGGVPLLPEGGQSGRAGRGGLRGRGRGGPGRDGPP